MAVTLSAFKLPNTEQAKNWFIKNLINNFHLDASDIQFLPVESNESANQKCQLVILNIEAYFNYESHELSTQPTLQMKQTLNP